MQCESSSVAGATSIGSWLIPCFLRDLRGDLKSHFLVICSFCMPPILTFARSLLCFWFGVPVHVVVFSWDIVTTQHALWPSCPDCPHLLSRHLPLPLQFFYKDRFLKKIACPKGIPACSSYLTGHSQADGDFAAPILVGKKAHFPTMYLLSVLCFMDAWGYLMGWRARSRARGHGLLWKEKKKEEEGKTQLF